MFQKEEEIKRRERKQIGGLQRPDKLRIIIDANC